MVKSAQSVSRATRGVTLTGATSGVTQVLAAHASGLRHEDVPEEVRLVARQCLLDWLGVTIAGAGDETAQLVREEARAEGGEPQASVLGTSYRLTISQAAQVNGTASHVLDYDDVHFDMPGHPTVPVAPALLALAERDDRSGRDLITSFVAGVEAECRIGRFLGASHYDAGWHATGTVGTLGAAAASARLLGLDAERTAAAVGIAAAHAAGLKSLFGTMCKSLHAGNAARNGLHAALLARRGFTSRDDILECAQGFNEAYAGTAARESALSGLGERFLTRNTLFKFHAACYATHASIDAATQVRETYRLEPASIGQIEVRVPPANLRICNIQDPTTGLEAKFSMRLTTAMALAGVGTDRIDTYVGETCAAPELVELRDKIRVVGDERLELGTSELIVTSRDGVVHRIRGDVSRPASDLADQGRRLQAKFRAIASPVVGTANAERVIEQVEQLDAADHVHGLVALCRPPNGK